MPVYEGEYEKGQGQEGEEDIRPHKLSIEEVKSDPNEKVLQEPKNGNGHICHSNKSSKVDVAEPKQSNQQREKPTN